MAEVTLYIGGRSHVVACRDGEEAQLEALGRRLEVHAPTAQRVAGAQGGERTMLFIALMLADQLAEAERATPTERAPSVALAPALLTQIAERLESVAEALEQSAASA